MEQQDYGSGVYIYTDEHNITWECKYTEEGHAYYINGQTGESPGTIHAQMVIDGWHEMTITEWNAWNADPSLEVNGGSNGNARLTVLHTMVMVTVIVVGMLMLQILTHLIHPMLPLDRVRAQLGKGTALKSSRKKKKQPSAEPGATARTGFGGSLQRQGRPQRCGSNEASLMCCKDRKSMGRSTLETRRRCGA